MFLHQSIHVSGHMLVSGCLFVTLVLDKAFTFVPMWIVTFWHISIVVSLKSLSVHGVLTICNKWIQGTLLHIYN